MFPLFRQERFDDLQESPTIQKDERMERWGGAVPSPQTITRKSLMLRMSSVFYEDRLNGAIAPHFPVSWTEVREGSRADASTESGLEDGENDTAFRHEKSCAADASAL
jgi:hypothetical protein